MPRASQQFQAWGVSVQNVRVSAAHVAEGLVMLLTATRQAAPEVVVTPDPSGVLSDQKERLAAAWGRAFRLDEPTRALCVTRWGSTTGGGDLSLSPGVENVPHSDQRKRAAYLGTMEAGRRHLKELVGLELGREAHVLVSRALNADLRVRIDGASTPTTPGPALLGFDSNYTLELLHAQTTLALLHSQAAPLFERLAQRICDGSDPHSRLAAFLQVDHTEERVRVEGLTVARPEGEDWDRAAACLAEAIKRLLAWTGQDGASVSKAELLTSMTDLVCLFFSTRILSWAPASEPARPASERVLLVAPITGHSRPARDVQNAARFSIQRALSRLQDGATVDSGLRISEKPQHSPGAAACALGASAGWLLPSDARGGARRFVAPGDDQLRTLVQAMVKPGEGYRWQVFHNRVLAAFSICLGGVRLQDFSGLGVSASAVRTAGELNQARLIELGLARREADDVVVVDGGGQ